MCLICTDYIKGSLTIKEAFGNLKEVYNEDDKHSNEVWIMLLKAELEKDTQ